MSKFMCNSNSVAESDVEAEVIYYPTREEDELYSLLEQVLMEVFVNGEDKESLEFLTGNAIYDLADEKEILNREKYAQEVLDEGCPDVEQFDELIELAEAYFRNPDSYPLEDISEDVDYVTGFVQILSGQKINNKGMITEYWKSTGCKIQIDTHLLIEPEKVILLIEQQGFVWSEIIRVVFYGSPLAQYVDSRFYSDKETKEFVPLDENQPRILLAVPDYEEVSKEDESIYDWIDREIQEGIPYGLVPNVGRIATGHWEMTKNRLDEIANEKLEENNLLLFICRERSAVVKKNSFIERYQEARALINGLNSGALSINTIYNKNVSVLEEVLYLSGKLNERIINPATFLQVKSLVTNSKVQHHLKQDSFALSIIQKINKGEFVEIHLIPLTELEKVFAILWGNLGIKIIHEKVEIYHQLKSRFLQLRNAKSGKYA